jgi:hypothetical protein
VPVFPGPLMDHVRVPVLRTPCHNTIFAPCATQDKGPPRGLCSGEL